MFEFMWAVVPSGTTSGPGWVDYTKGVFKMSAYCASVSTKPIWPCATPLRLYDTVFEFALVYFCSLWRVYKVNQLRIGVRLDCLNDVSL